MDKRLIPLLLIVGVLIVSGCTGKSNASPVKSASETGLRILDFGSDQDIVDSNGELFVELNLKNSGEQKATNVRAKIFNPPFGECPGCWKIRGNGPDCGLLGPDWICLGDFNEPDRLSNFDGDEKNGFWNLRAPGLPSGRSLDTKFYSRIHYGYQTQATGQIELINRNELRGKNVSAAIVGIDNSKGPIEFSSDSSTPVLVTDGQGSLNFCIHVKNVGRGKVYDPDAGLDVGASDIDRLDVSVSFEGLGIIKEKSMKIDGTTCFEFSPGEVSIRKTVPITITGRYNYYEDAEFDVEVEGV